MGGSNNRFRGRRLTAVLGAVALSLIGAVGAAAPASADSGNIDFGKLGSIIIHKHVHQSGQTGSPTGGNLTSPGVENVGFTAFPITSLPLTDAASWSTLDTLVAPATACDGAPSIPDQTFGPGVDSPLTNASGQATITSLPVAAYLLCETVTPSTVVDKAQPFIVTIPYSYNQSWLYDVNVYPKNGLVTVSKTVTEQTDLGLGSTSFFPVTTDVPKIAGNATFQYYWVQDAMDSRMTGATVASVKVVSTNADVPSGYYTVSPPSGTNVVSVEFNHDGLAWLSTLGPDKIKTTFTGVVGATLGDGMISDTAYLGAKTAVGSAPSNPASPPADPSTSSSVVASQKVTQNWGDLKVKKVDSGSTSTGLAGATFQVWEAADPYGTCSVTTTGTTPVTVGATTDFTTDAAGALTIAGLFVSDSKNGTTDASQRCYVLVETAAPAGFVLPVGDAAKTAVAVKTGVTVGVDATITNLRYALAGLELPMTGSNGIVVLTIAGTVLIAAGLLLAFLARRRKQTA